MASPFIRTFFLNKFTFLLKLTKFDNNINCRIYYFCGTNYSISHGKHTGDSFTLKCFENTYMGCLGSGQLKALSYRAGKISNLLLGIGVLLLLNVSKICAVKAWLKVNSVNCLSGIRGA